MLSMTGYGTGQVASEAATIGIQVAVVNHRHCQVQVRGELRSPVLDEKLRSRTRSALRRGSVTVQVSVAGDASLGLDLEGITTAWKAMASAAEAAGAPVPTFEGVAKLVGRSDGPDATALESQAIAALDQALEAVTTMRSVEGQALKIDFGKRLERIDELRSAMATRAPERLRLHREQLLEKMQQILGEELDPAVLARECALHTDRLDITEELVRLASHCEQFTALLEGNTGGDVGKRIEFLLQELGREVNTVGSKANDAELTALVVEAKNTLEQMREQAANVL